MSRDDTGLHRANRLMDLWHVALEARQRGSRLATVLNGRPR